MIDTLVENLDKARASRITLETLGLKKSGFVYVTLHRPSNVDAKGSLTENHGRIEASFEADAGGLSHASTHPKDVRPIWNFARPTTNGLRILDPIGYHDSLYLTEHARLVLTDSGGLQEESTYFKTRCLTLRPNTERPITVTLGSNKLTDLDHLSADICEALSRNGETGHIPPLWDGQTSQRIVDCLIAGS